MKPGNFNSNLSAIVWVVELLLDYNSSRKEREVTPRPKRPLSDIAKVFTANDGDPDGLNTSLLTAPVPHP